MYERIVVPVDGSPTSNLGLREAIELARMSQGRLRLLHVVDIMSLVAAAGEGYTIAPVDILGPARKAGEAILQQGRAMVQAAGLDADTELVENTKGRVADCIVDEAARWGAGLIVLGTHGRRGARRMLLGSDAEQVARVASVPVLLVRDQSVSEPRT